MKALTLLIVLLFLVGCSGEEPISENEIVLGPVVPPDVTVQCGYCKIIYSMTDGHWDCIVLDGGVPRADTIQICDTTIIEVGLSWVAAEIIWNADTTADGRLPPCPSGMAEVEWIAKQRYKHKTISTVDSNNFVIDETTVYLIDSITCRDTIITEEQI